MRHTLQTVLAVSSLLLALSVGALAQQPSLADLARQERTKKGKEAPRTGKVFTNEDIPAPTLAGAADTAATPAGEPSTPAPGQTPAAADAAAQPSQEELEKQYREKFAGLKENLDTQERRLDVLQRELNLMQQQFYADPNVALQQQNTREDINKRTEEIEAQKLAVEKAKQAIADLETELQRKALPAGWAR